MKSAKLLVVAAIIVAVRPSLFGQTDPNAEQGLKGYGSFHGGSVDSVSLTNGNLTLHSPIWSVPQRGGLGFELGIRYNNKGFTVAVSPSGCSQGGNINRCTNTVVSKVTGVFIAETHSFTGAADVPQALSSWTDQSGNLVPFTKYDVTAADGSTHTVGDLGTGWYQAIDGSGYRYNPTTNVTMDANGTTSNTGVITDRNGNQMNVSTGVDTVNRMIPQSVTAGNTAQCPSLGYAFQAVTSASNYNFGGPNGNTTTLVLCYASVQIRTNFWGGGYPGGTYLREAARNVSMLQSILLPNGTYWAFQYDAADPNNTASIAYGDLLKVTLPSGGSITYTWTTSSPCINSDSLIPSRAVTSRTVDANDGTGGKKWNYSGAGGGLSLVTDPLGNDTVHTITGLGGTCSLFETQTDYYQGSSKSGTLLKTVKTDYSWTSNPYDGNGSSLPNTVAGVVPIRVTTLLPGGLTSKVETDYDSGFVYRDPLYGSSRPAPPVTSTYQVTYGRPIAQREYDWGQGAAGPLLRQTLTTYQWQVNGNYLSANLLNLPSSVKVQDGAGNLCSRTDYGYDDPNYLTASGITTQHGAPVAVRGNLSTVTRWLSSNPCTSGATWTTVVSHTNVYDTGMPYQVIDPLKNTTTMGYDPAFAGAYVTSVTNALGQVTKKSYDFNTGLITSVQDPNDVAAGRAGTTSSYDNLLRPTVVTLPNTDASGNHGQITYCYSDTPGSSCSAPLPPKIVMTKSITSSISEVTTISLDGLGRKAKTELSDPEGDDFVDIAYDANGRVSTLSNPHRSSASATDGTTTNSYDALGRVTQTTAQDASISTTDYSNFPTVTVTDPAGKTRRSRTDALGRLVEVDEPGPGANTAGSPGQGSINISGSLQSSTSSGTKATGSVTVSGFVQTMYISVCTDTCFRQRKTDPGGNVSITVNGHANSVSYGGSSTATSIATALIGNINGDNGAFVWASGPSCADSTDCTISLQARTPGPNYSLSAQGLSNDEADGFTSFDRPSASGSSLTGGVYPVTTYDSGTLTVTVSGSGIPTFQASASYNQNLNNTPQLMASALASALSVTGSPVTATPNGTAINIVAKGVGTATNFTVSGGTSTSFTASSTTLSQGTNPGGFYAPYVTSYSYDPLGNLLQVNQAGDGVQAARVRTFSYDSLSHLLTSNNPETGTISYTYDADGNMLQKTSPQANQVASATTTISYCYDALNRVTGKAYTAQSCLLSSPVVTYAYDQTSANGLTIANGIGRRTSMADQAGSEAWSYDPVGHPLSDLRTTSGVTKTTSYGYNLDGSGATLVYPSGRMITYGYSKAGRLLSAVDAGNSVNYVTGALYTPPGELSSLLNGANLTSAFYYNSRLQPCRLSVTSGSGVPATCTDVTVGNILDLSYSYNIGSGDNGDIVQITNHRDSTRSQSFTYDQLNRLATANTNATSGANCWGENFGYDAWGNLLSIGGLAGYTGCTQENLSVNVTTKNQLVSSAYDAAGNMTGVMAGATFDAENRLVTAGGISYLYDGDGRRVQKSNGKIYWYGMGSNALDETDLSGSMTNSSFNEYVFFNGERIARRDSSGNIFYYFADHLGTSRVIVQAGQTAPCYDADFYPFGGERTAVVNNCPQNYKFSGKERDGESGLDEFGARYYSSALGRFITPDWSAGPSPVPYAHLDNPQTLNLYAYVDNNPINGIDEDGHAPLLAMPPPVSVSCDATAQGCSPFPSNSAAADELWAQLSAWEEALAAANNSNNNNSSNPPTEPSGNSDPISQKSTSPDTASGSGTASGSPESGRPLTDYEKQKLAPYVPREDLDNARLHDGKVPKWFLNKKYDGVTLHNDIYFRKGVYNSSTPQGLAALAHELYHVGQYRKKEMTVKSYMWEGLRHGGGEKNKYEAPAYRFQERVLDALRKDW